MKVCFSESTTKQHFAAHAQSNVHVVGIPLPTAAVSCGVFPPQDISSGLTELHIYNEAGENQTFFSF